MQVHLPFVWERRCRQRWSKVDSHIRVLFSMASAHRSLK